MMTTRSENSLVGLRSGPVDVGSEKSDLYFTVPSEGTATGTSNSLFSQYTFSFTVVFCCYFGNLLSVILFVNLLQWRICKRASKTAIVLWRYTPVRRTGTSIDEGKRHFEFYLLPRTECQQFLGGWWGEALIKSKYSEISLILNYVSWTFCNISLLLIPLFWGVGC